MATQKEVKEIKDLGWAHIAVTKTNFNGGIMEYDTETGGKVAVLFVMEAAYVLEDAEGLYEKNDLIDGVMKAKGVDHSNPSSISGTTVLGSYDSFEEESEVSVNAEELTRLGLNYYEVEESIKNRLKVLQQIQQKNMAQLG